jgi:membrane protease YdiL (CAAX protease family)
MPETASPSNRALLLPYAVPYAVYVLLGSAPLPPEQTYVARVVLTGAALAWAWSRYASFRGPRPVSGSVTLGILAGVLGTALWVGLVLPFAPEPAPAPPGAAIALRIGAATLLVPIFEELLLRGYVLRLVVQWDHARTAGAADPLGDALDRSSVNEVAPGAWTFAAVAISTALFALGHRPFEWVAAVAYGLGMALLWVRRGDLLVCVVAHAVTNLTLGLYVAASGSWRIW